MRSLIVNKLLIVLLVIFNIWNVIWSMWVNWGVFLVFIMRLWIFNCCFILRKWFGCRKGVCMESLSLLNELVVECLLLYFWCGRRVLMIGVWLLSLWLIVRVNLLCLVVWIMRILFLFILLEELKNWVWMLFVCFILVV